MRHRPSTFLKRFAQLVLLTALPASMASAQNTPDIGSILHPGMTVWITDATGRDAKVHVAGVSDGIVTTSVGDQTRRVLTGDITRISVRRSDPVLNGALIGAGAAVASGLFLCRLTESWANCRDDVGPMFRIGAVGAGIGIGIDALIRCRRTIYEAPAGFRRLHASPIVARGTTGLRFSLSF
jgi:hypothetical protein